MDIPDFLKDLAIPISFALIAGIVTAIKDATGKRKTDAKVEEAEKNVFSPQLNSNSDSQEEKLVKMFYLFNSQLDKYQNETRSRANWSFFFAIGSMIFGLWFIYWGAKQFYSGDEGGYKSIGLMVTALGGAVSGYITKTFLSAHKLALEQLHAYYVHPRINFLILMGQRLAEESKDEEIRKKTYSDLIQSIRDLIAEKR